MAARLAYPLVAVALLLAACDRGAKPTSDPYDPSKMDLKPDRRAAAGLREGVGRRSLSE